MMDLSRFSTDDLKALREGDLGRVSTEGLKLLKTMVPAEPVPAPKQSTIGSEFRRGLESLISTGRTGIGAITGSPEEAARAGLERGERIAAEAGEGPSLERLKRIFDEKGFLEASKAAVGDVPRIISGQVPQLGAMAAGARLGAMAGAPFGPPGALIGGGLGALVPLAPSMFGQMVERQASEQRARGEPIAIERGPAAAATAGALALEVGGAAGTLGKSLVKRVLGIADDPALLARASQEQLVAAANRSLAGAAARGAGRGAVIEMPVEVAQSVLERAQAGLPVTGDDAFTEYGEAAYLAGVTGGALGTAGGVSSRGAARRQAAVIEEQQRVAREAELDRTAREMGPPEPTPVQGTLFEGPRRTQLETPVREQALAQAEQTSAVREEIDRLQQERNRLLAQAEAEQDATKKEQLRAQATNTNERLKAAQESYAQMPQDLFKLRDEFDTLQRENQRLRAQYEQETDPTKKEAIRAEAAKLAPQLRAVQQEYSRLRAVTPEEAPGARRPQAPEEQLELPFDNTIRLQDLVELGIPMEGGSPAVVGVRGWMRDNVLGKTPEQVQRMVDKKPDLLEGQGLRARVLRDLISPKPVAYEEPVREPVTEPRSAPAAPEQRELDFGGTEPSVGVPIAVGTESERGAQPTPLPTEAELSGLARPEVDVGVGARSEEARAPALEKATTEWDEYKPDGAPAFDQLPARSQAEWGNLVTRSGRLPTIADADRIYDNALRDAGYQAYIFEANRPKSAFEGQMFALTGEGRVAQAFYDGLPDADKQKVLKAKETFQKQERMGSAAVRRQEEADLRRRRQEEAEEKDVQEERQQEEASRAEEEKEGPPTSRKERRAKKVGAPKPTAEKPEEQMGPPLPGPEQAGPPLPGPEQAGPPLPGPEQAGPPRPAQISKAAKAPIVTEEPTAEKPSRIQGTPEQRRIAQKNADDFGGFVVWQNGDYALVRGYSIRNGQPVYIGTKDIWRTSDDIEYSKVEIFPTDVKREMVAVKKELEKEDADKHASNPFITFDADGVALSKDIAEEYAGIVREWKKLLKLDADIYVSTIEDARKNKENFTGPHRAIGSGTINRSESGSLRKMGDNTYYILFDASPKKTKNLEILAHEMGHLHQKLFFDSATPTEQNALRKAHADWLKSTKGKTAKDLVESMRGRATSDVTGDLSSPAEEMDGYWRLFDEWYADQTARWALSSDKPVTIVEKFFARLGAALRNFYNTLKAKKYLPNETFAQYLEAMISRPDKTNLQPIDAKDDRTASAMVTGTAGTTPPALVQGFSPQPGGTARQMADSARSGILKFRTTFADKAATVFNDLSKAFNNDAAKALELKEVEAAYRQAEASDQMVEAFYRMGFIERDPKTKLWKVVEKPGKAPPAKIVELAQTYAKDNNLSFEDAWSQLSQILQAAREHTFREHNANRQAGVQALPRNMPDPEVDRLYQIYQSDATVKEIVKVMDTVRFDMIDNMVAVGRISKDTADAWKEASNYVPLDRLVDLDVKLRTPQKRFGRGIAQLGKLPELVDAEWVKQPPKNVLENYYNTMGWMLQQTVKQDATLRTLRALEDAGQAKFFKYRPTDRNVSDRLVQTFYKGEEVYFLVDTPYQAVAFNVQMAPTMGFVKLMSQFSRALRTAITAVPTFTAAQLPQDIQRAIMYSGVKDPLALSAKVLGNFAAFSKAAVQGKLAEVAPDLAKFGVAGGVDFHISNPAESFLQDMGVRQRTLFKSSTAGTLLNRLQAIAVASDLAMRQAIYDQTMKETQGDELLATQRAREIINFRRYGAGDRLGLLHWATQTVPFYNAYLQGMDVLYRSLTGKEAPSGLDRNAALKMFWNKAAFVLGASMVYSMAMADDDEYENMDLRERDRTWVIGGGIGIPVPSELGILLKALPERVLEYYRKVGTPDERIAMEAIIAYFKTDLRNEYFGRVVPIPVAIKPIAEVVTNYSFLTGREIEGIFQKQQLPSERTTSRTSEFAKAVAQFMAAGPGIEVSPIAIDTVLQGYFGTTAALGLAVADQMINPNKTDRPLHQIVGMAPFAYDPVGTRRTTEFYDLREKVVQSQNSLNQMLKTDPDRAAAFAEKNASLLASYKMINSTLQELEKTREYKRYLDTEMAAQSMSSEERLKMKQDVQAYEQRLVEWVRFAKNELKI